MNREHFIRNLWRWKCGLPEIPPTKPNPNLVNDLWKTEWSPEFEQMMRNRLVMGAIRYGRMGHGEIPLGKPKYDRFESIRKRLRFFEETGNAEWLVDIANLALLMFEERYHQNFHVESVDGDSEKAYHDKIL